ncbi:MULTISPECIES: YdeI/OmpD-associated family protein [unclassified Rathayibacter]|uniref:YdeI/OmpD-associated family protein n=1 Tax=unclassified Rathayibacter TaxID=2609250 RepID=UPI000AE3084F|nr:MULTISPECIES: YdeI/OmpD-associated family protein [unclassified Rathayibacter]
MHVETREDWRRWLVENHRSERAVWLVSWKKATGRPAVTYDDAVSEALAVGWVDSRPRTLDDERTMLYFTPRKPTSAWSRPNKLRVDRLRSEGAMLPAGEEVIAAAIATGAWTLLDDVDLVVPPDLADAFAEYENAERNWNAFTRSARRGILEWIVQATRPETRERRVRETARLAESDQRAAQWTPKQRS